MRISAATLLANLRNEASLIVYGHVRNVSEQTIVRHFGATPKIMVVIWSKLDNLFDISQRHEIQHLLMTLYLVKRYPTDIEMERACQKSSKTIRKATNPIRKMFLTLIHSTVCMLLNLDPLQQDSHNSGTTVCL